MKGWGAQALSPSLLLWLLACSSFWLTKFIAESPRDVACATLYAP